MINIEVFPKTNGKIIIYEADDFFYEVTLEKREDNAYLVTGNMKQYPVWDSNTIPAEIVTILEEQKAQERKENK